MEIKTIPKDNLHFQEMKQIDFKLDIPILINNKCFVLLGNSVKNILGNDVKVISISANNYLNQCLFDLEKIIVDENNLERVYQFQEEISQYIYSELNNIDKNSLFEVKEYGLIDEAKYIKPPEYNFEKHNTKKKKDDGVNNENLFSFA